MSRNSRGVSGFGVIVILGFILVFGGIGVFIQSISVITQGIGLGIYAIFQVFWHLPTSFYDLVASGATANWTLTNVVWIDTILINVATFIPSIIVFVITRIGVKIPTVIATIISIAVLVAVLELFASIIFWIVLGVLILVGIVSWVLIATGAIKIPDTN